MNKSSNGLRTMYEEVLGKDPFPTYECDQVRMTGEEHGILVLYLADIAGLASRGEKLRKIVDPEKTKFRIMASRGLYDRCPMLERKISPEKAPKLRSLVEATERARLVILQELSVEAV